MKLAVLGAAESGVGAAILAQQKGYDVFVSDMGTIRPHYKEMLTISRGKKANTRPSDSSTPMRW